MKFRESPGVTYLAYAVSYRFFAAQYWLLHMHSLAEKLDAGDSRGGKHSDITDFANGFEPRVEHLKSQDGIIVIFPFGVKMVENHHGIAELHARRILGKSNLENHTLLAGSSGQIADDRSMPNDFLCCHSRPNFLLLNKSIN